MPGLKRFHWTLVATALFAFPSTVRAAAPDIVKYVPDGAAVVVTVPSLTSLSNKIALLNQKLALNQPQMNSALGFAKTMSGITQGIDDRRGAAIILTSLPNVSFTGGKPSGPDAKGFALLPVSDYDAFLSNFGGRNRASGGISELRFMNKQIFARQAGPYVVLSDDEQTVSGYTQASKGGMASRAGHFGRQILGHSDFSFYVDIAQFGPAVRPMAKQQMRQMKRMMKQFGGAMDPEMSQFMNAYLGIYGSIIDAVLRDGDIVITGIDVSPDGIGFSHVTQFKQDSRVAGVFSESPSAAPTLSRLPRQPYLMAMTLNTSTLPVKQWYRDLVSAFPQDSGWSSLFTGSQTMVDAIGSESQFVMYKPKAGEAAAGGFNGLWVVSTDDPGTFVAAYQSYIDEMNNVQLGGIGYQTTFQAAARQIGDRDIDQYLINVKVPENLKSQMGPGGLMENQTGTLFQVDDAVVIGLNLDDATLAAAVTAAGGTGKLDSDPGITEVRRFLPGSCVGQAFFNVGGFIELAQQLSPRPLPIRGSFGNMPPVAVAAGAYNGSIGVRGFVPMRTIATIKNTIEANTMSGRRGGRTRR